MKKKKKKWVYGSIALTISVALTISITFFKQSGNIIQIGEKNLKSLHYQTTIVNKQENIQEDLEKIVSSINQIENGNKEDVSIHIVNIEKINDTNIYVVIYVANNKENYAFYEEQNDKKLRFSSTFSLQRELRYYILSTKSENAVVITGENTKNANLALIETNKNVYTLSLSKDKKELFLTQKISKNELVNTVIFK